MHCILYSTFKKPTKKMTVFVRHYHLEVKANPKKIAQKKGCYF